jgi:hypothetical protein
MTLYFHSMKNNIVLDEKQLPNEKFEHAIDKLAALNKIRTTHDFDAIVQILQNIPSVSRDKYYTKLFIAIHCIVVDDRTLGDRGPLTLFTHVRKFWHYTGQFPELERRLRDKFANIIESIKQMEYQLYDETIQNFNERPDQINWIVESPMNALVHPMSRVLTTRNLYSYIRDRNLYGEDFIHRISKYIDDNPHLICIYIDNYIVYRNGMVKTLRQIMDFIRALKNPIRVYCAMRYSFIQKIEERDLELASFLRYYKLNAVDI